MQYYVDNLLTTESDFFAQLEDAVYNDVDENYDDILDDAYGDVVIGSLHYAPSQVLKAVDPIAYRVSISDEISFQLSDYQYEFESESENCINGIVFKTIEEPEAI